MGVNTEPSALEAGRLPEPGPDLERSLTLLEQRVRAQLAEGPRAEGRDASSPPPVGGRDVLLLIGCVRELLRDREALLEEIEALELTADRPRSR
jgi:hypothetical protein